MPKLKPEQTYKAGCFTVREIAQTYGVAERVVWDAIRAGKLSSRIQHFQLRMIEPEAAEAWASAAGLELRTPRPSWLID